MSDVSSVGYVADWLQASYQIRADRTQLPERPLSGENRVDRIRETLERAGAEPDRAALPGGVGERIDIFL